MPKNLLSTLSLVAHYGSVVSKPKVFVAFKEVPKSAIDLLHERLAIVLSLKCILQLVLICLLYIICFRFDVEISSSGIATHEEVLEKITGKFGIFCCPSVRVNEEIIKAAGKK